MLPASDNYHSFMKGNVKGKGNEIHDVTDHLNNYRYANSKYYKKKKLIIFEKAALACVAQWIEHRL